MPDSPAPFVTISLLQRIARTFEKGSDTAAKSRQLIAECGVSPVKWAAYYRRHLQETRGIELNEFDVVTWFANAMEAAHKAQPGQCEAEFKAAAVYLVELAERETAGTA